MSWKRGMRRNVFALRQAQGERIAAFSLFAMLHLLFVPFAWSADGGAVLSLPQLLEEIRWANPDLASARKRWEAASARIPQARGLPAPRIGVEFEEIPRGTVKLNQATIMYQLIQSLPFPGKLSLRHRVAVAEAQMAASSYKQAEWEATSMLKSVYYDLFLIDRTLEIQRAQQVWLNQASASAEARYSTGMASQSDFLRVQEEALEAANEISILGHRRQALAAHLNHLLDRPADAPAGEPEALSLLSVPSTPQELFTQAQENQPELLMFKFAAERADASWRLQKRELLPDLETMVELRNPAMGPVGPWDLTLALVLPFWFWTKQKYGVKAALYDKESALDAYDGAKNEIARRIHENWHEAKGAYETAKLCRQSLIPLARQNVASAMAAYQGGQGSFQEFLGALQDLSRRQRTYYEHLVVLEQRLILLEQAVGVPLRPSSFPVHPSTGSGRTGGNLQNPDGISE